MEIGRLPENEFIKMIVKMIQWKTVEKMKKTKDLQELRNKQAKMNNTLEGINSRITEADEWVNDLEERHGGNSLPQNRIQKKRMERN